MVKAPRSKGCRVCVDRRVKCDQRRPFCVRCEKSGRQCPGFENVNFVNEGPHLRNMYERGKDESARDSSLSSSPRIANAPRKRSRRNLYNISDVSTVRLPKETDAGPDFERSSLVAFMAPSAFQAQLLSSFIQTISSSDPANLVPTYQCYSTWLSSLATSTSVSTTLMWSLRALSLSHLGHQMQDRNLIQNSRAMYGKALLHLNKSLQDPEEGLSTDTLSATALLSFYEILTCTKRDAWVQHAGGAAKLIQIRGPDRHRTGRDSVLFLSCRWSFLLQSFHTREKCFLTEPAWRALSRHLTESSPRRSRLSDAVEEVFQTVIDLPEFMFNAVDYIEGSEADPTKLQELIHQTHLYRNKYKSLQSRVGKALEEAGLEVTKTASSQNDKMFPVVYQYPNIMVGSSYCGYWASMCMLNVILIGLEVQLQPVIASPTTASVVALDIDVGGPGQKSYLMRTIESLPDRTSPAGLWALPPADEESKSPLITAASPKDYPTMSVEDTLKRRNMYVEENIHYARETCRSVESLHTAAFLGPMFLIFALRAAIRTLRSREEKAWIMEKLEVISKNFSIAKEEAEVYREHSGQINT